MLVLSRQRDESIMIGDNIVVDLSPAKYIGMKTVAFNTHVDLFVNSNKAFDQLFS